VDASEVAIERLLPHRGDMRWVHTLLSCDANAAVVEAVVRDDHPLADADGVPAFAGIEFMAQAIAVWAGGRALARGQAVKHGYLLGTRHYACQRPHFAFGLRLRIEVECELFGDNGLGLFACRIRDDDAVIASANVTVFEPPASEAVASETNAASPGSRSPLA
jgi:predicted hotdog family 3-hydroxylacyl-ACP dehydratase